MYTRGLIPTNFAELADAAPIGVNISTSEKLSGVLFRIAAVYQSVRDGSGACVCDPVSEAIQFQCTI